MSIRSLIVALALLLPASVGAQGITIPNTFVNGTAADATQVNANFSSLANNALNRTAGTMTGVLTTVGVVPTVTNTSDLGSTSLLYRSGYFRTSLVLGQAAGNYTLTWANPAAARAISFEDPGGTDILAYKAATQTLTNKTLTAPVLSGTATGSYTMGGTGVWNAGAVTSSGLLTVTGFGQSQFNANGTGMNNVRLLNATSGAAAGVNIELVTDGSGEDFLAQSFSTGYTSTGNQFAAGTRLLSTGTGGLSLASVGPLRVFSNATETARFHVSRGVSIGNTTDPGATNLSVTGRITTSTQPGFLAFNSANDLAQTNGATIDFDTEVYDEAGNFAADVFTAPVTGRYLFTVSVQVLTPSMATGAGIQLSTSNRSYTLDFEDSVATVGSDTLSGSVIADLDVGDTATVLLLLNAGNIIVAGTTGATFFSGRLLP